MSPRDLAAGASPLAALIGNLNERDCKVIPWPKREGVAVGLWVLTQHEEEQARKAAFAYVRDGLRFSELDLAWDEQRALNDSIMIECLVRGLRDPNDPTNAFAESSTELRQRLNPIELSLLFKEYLAHRSEVAMLEEIEDLDKFLDDLVDRLGKGYPVAASLSYLSTQILRELLHTAAGRLVSAATASSSDSSSPSDSSPASTA